MKKKSFFGSILIFLGLCLSGCNFSVFKPIKVTSLELDHTQKTMYVGDDPYLLTYEIGPENAENKDVTFQSDDELVATVDEAGNVTPVSRGECVITCTSVDNSNVKDSINIIVKQHVTALSLNYTSYTFESENETFNLVANIEPENANNKDVTFKSSDDSVATVNAEGKVTAKNNGDAVITVKTKDSDFTATCNVSCRFKVESVSINKDEINFNNIEQSCQLTPKVLPENAYNKSVSYVSSNTNIATVTNDGLVKPVSNGECSITVKTADGNKNDSCNVKVQFSVTSLSLDKENYTFTEVNATLQLNATISPSNAFNKKINWTSSNPTIASVSDAGLVTALHKGTSVITASTEDGNFSKECLVTCSFAVTGISLNVNDVTLTESASTYQLSCSITPEEANNQNVTWSSNNTNVATVDQDGLVTGIANGNAVITVESEDGKYTATCNVKVEFPVHVSGISLTQSPKTQKTFKSKNETLQLTYEITPSDATNKNVTYVSDKPAIASVSDTGLVTALTSGTAIITVTTVDGGKSTTFKAICNLPISVESVSLNTTSKTFTKRSESLSLVATVLPEDAANKKVTFTSSDTSVAVVDSNGVVSPVNDGSCTITCTTEDGGLTATCAITVAFEASDSFGFGYYDDYYGELTWTNSEDLIEKLYDIISNDYQSLEYDWYVNIEADAEIDDFDMLNLVYDVNSQFVDNPFCGAHEWDKEHAFCASLMTSRNTGDAVAANCGRATDYHNLFASNSSGNRSRGNSCFGEVNEGTTITAEGYANDGVTFEPGDDDKGILSRAIFYMAVRYSKYDGDETHEFTTGSGASKETATFKYKPVSVVEGNVAYDVPTYSNWKKTNSTKTYQDYADYCYNNWSFSIGNLSTLLNWAKPTNYPVSLQEYKHNSVVSKYQHNRNPFVDYPELVDYCFGNAKNTAGSLEYLKPSCLDLNATNKAFRNYAVGGLTRLVENGSTFTKDNYTVYKVNNDLSSIEFDHSLDSTQDYTFTVNDIGQYITKNIVIGEQIIPVKFRCTTNTSSLSNRCTLTSYNTKNITNGGNITLYGTEWNVSWINAEASVGTFYSNYGGLSIGSSTKSAAVVILQTTSSYSNVDKIYVKVGTNSGHKVICDFYVNNNKLLTDEYNYIQYTFDPVGGSVTSSTGKIKIVLTVDAGLYLGFIGFNAN